MPDKGDFGSSELYETTRGGERALIRRLRPEDMGLYPDFLADVGAEDLRLRFFAHIAELSAEERNKLSHLDYRHEMAFIALDEDSGRMLGLVRLKDELDEQTAEFAILVRSRRKGHGLGWLLMKRVIRRHAVAHRRTIGMMAAALIGAAVGILLAWLLEITGHPWWSVVLMILCAIGPSILIALYERGERRPTKFLGWIRWQGSPWIKVVVALLLVAATLLVLQALHVNPRDYAYLPLLPPVIVSAILLGFGPALFAVVVSTIFADYVYAPPEYSFAITDWKEAVGLATFAILGGFVALIFHELFY